MYAASKHAVVALSEELFNALSMAGLPIGVSVLCPGFVRTAILDSERSWPSRLGERPPRSVSWEVLRPYYEKALNNGMPTDEVADLVADAIESGKSWVLPHPEWVELAAHRWQRIAAGENPDATVNAPGFPPTAQIASEIKAAMS